MPTFELIQLFEVSAAPTSKTRLSRRTSLGDLVAAARALTGRDRAGARTDEMPLAPMMGSLAYLIFLEVCGKLFVANPTGPPNPDKSTERIPFALRHWSPKALGCNEATCQRIACRTYPSGSPRPYRLCTKAAHLYALRCSLAHDYGLEHSNMGTRPTHFSFSLAMEEPSGSPVVTLPKRPWGGPPRPASVNRTTFVNLDALGDLAEQVRRNIVGDPLRRWNRKIVLRHLEDGEEVPEEELRVMGMDSVDDVQREEIRNDPLSSGVYCGARGGLAALDACRFDYEDWG